MASILITGAARRIGRALAEDLASLDMPLALHYNRGATEAEDLRDRLRANGARAELFQCDLSVETATGNLIPAVRKRLGPVRILVNNAAIFEAEDWQDVSTDSWNRHMAINLRAPFILTQSMAKEMPAGEKAVVINMIDQRVLNLNPHFVSYTLAKSALWSLTQTMALALAPDIRVNAVGPGPTLPNERQDRAMFETQVESTPLQTRVKVSAICDAVRYLITAHNVTGQLLAVDSGEHLGWAQPAQGFVPDE